MKVKEKKIIFIFILLLIMTIFIGIAFASFNGNMKETSSKLLDNGEENIPDVSLDNTSFDISDTEVTNENITVTITSKLEDYNLYYGINPKEVAEPENEETSEENQEIHNLENETDVLEDNELEYALYQDRIEIEANSDIYFKYELDGKYSEKAYVLEINNIDKEEIMLEALENEGATEEELSKEKVTNIDNTAPYYIIVNYTSNVVTVYGKDSNNEYTVPVKAMVCSTGTATPRSGVYKLTKTRYRWGALFGGVYGQYAVKIVGNILFHSVPYLSADNSTLEYWEYDKLGTSASAGCVRLTVADALWIYNNCGSGTQVEFSSNASNPLGKPSAQKISSYQNLRGYDPTDPASNNPWRNANISTSTEVTTQNNDTTGNQNVDNSSSGSVSQGESSSTELEKEDSSKSDDTDETKTEDDKDTTNPTDTEGDNNSSGENLD